MTESRARRHTFASTSLRQVDDILFEAIQLGASSDKVAALLDQRENSGLYLKTHHISNHITGDTFLHIAARYGHGTLIQLLMRRGHARNVVNLSGATPMNVCKDDKTAAALYEDDRHRLIKSACDNDLKTMSKLWKHLSFRNVLDSQTKMSAVHGAAQQGACQTLRYLVEDCNMPVNVSKVKFGLTPLHYAVRAKQFACIQLLLDFGANPQLEDINGNTPVDLAPDVVSKRALMHALPEIMRDVSHHREYFEHCVRSGFLCDGFVCHRFDDQSELDENRNIDEEHEIPGRASVNIPGPKMSRGLVEWIAERAIRNNEASCQHQEGVIWMSSTELGRDTTTSVTNMLCSVEPFCYSIAISLRSQLENKCWIRKRTNAGVVSLASPFVLTNDKGERTYCMCVAMSRPSEQLDQNGRNDTSETAANYSGSSVVTFCLLSKWPMFSLFAQTLGSFALDASAYLQQPKSLERSKDGRETERKTTEYSSAVNMRRKHMSCVEALLRTEFPLRETLANKRVIVSIPSPLLSSRSRQSTSKVAVSWPAETALPFIDDNCMVALLACLSIENIAQVVAALLTEQSVLVVSTNIPLLTPCCEALVALLFPIEWVHTYVPLLPPNFASIIEAPSPLLVGMHTDSLGKTVTGERLASLLLVNLDANSVVLPMDQDLNLPDSLREKIVGELSDVRAVIQESFNSTIPMPSNIDGSSGNGGKEFIFGNLDHGSGYTCYVLGMPYHLFSGLESEIRHIRVCFSEALASLFGSLSLCDFDRNAQVKFVTSQSDLSRRIFLQHIFATSLWRCFVDDVRAGNSDNTSHNSNNSNSMSRNGSIGLSQSDSGGVRATVSIERDLQLEAFKECVDRGLGLERWQVCVNRLVVYKDANLASRFVSCVYARDIITASLSHPLVGGRVWLKLQNMEGWCLVMEGKDADRLHSDSQHGAAVSNYVQQSIVTIGNIQVYADISNEVKPDSGMEESGNEDEVCNQEAQRQGILEQHNSTYTTRIMCSELKGHGHGNTELDQQLMHESKTKYNDSAPSSSETNMTAHQESQLGVLSEMPNDCKTAKVPPAIDSVISTRLGRRAASEGANAGGDKHVRQVLEGLTSRWSFNPSSRSKQTKLKFDRQTSANTLTISTRAGYRSASEGANAGALAGKDNERVKRVLQGLTSRWSAPNSPRKANAKELANTDSVMHDLDFLSTDNEEAGRISRAISCNVPVNMSSSILRAVKHSSPTQKKLSSEVARALGKVVLARDKLFLGAT